METRTQLERACDVYGAGFYHILVIQFLRLSSISMLPRCQHSVECSLAGVYSHCVVNESLVGGRRVGGRLVGGGPSLVTLTFLVPVQIAFVGEGAVADVTMELV